MLSGGAVRASISAQASWCRALTCRLSRVPKSRNQRAQPAMGDDAAHGDGTAEAARGLDQQHPRTGLRRADRGPDPRMAAARDNDVASVHAGAARTLPR